MKSHRGPAATTALTVVAAILVGPVSPATAAAGDGVAFTLRYSGQGWADVTQAGAASLACPADSPACQDGSDPAVPTSWVDVDSDPSTMNSSRAVLAIPPKANVDWVGLYWTGDRGRRADGVEPRCDAAPDGATPPILPPAPDKANQVRLSVGTKPYAVVTANSFTTVTGPGGGTGFQAYVDITAAVRAAGATTQLALTVGELQVASGPGCGGGWTAVLAYSYVDGPDKTYAPDFRGIAVYDGTLIAPAGVAQQVQLAGIAAASQDGPPPRLSSSLFASGQSLGADSLTLGDTSVPRTGDGVTGITGLPGPGYQRATSPLPPASVKPDVALHVVSVRSGFVTAVLGLSTPLQVKVNLTVATEVNPTTVAVGGEATITVTVRNDATVSASGVRVSVQLPAGLTLVSGADDYDPGAGVWAVGAVAAHGSAELSLRVLVQNLGDLVSTAQISGSDLPNQNPPAPASAIVTAVPASASTSSAPVAPPTVATEAWTWTQIAPAMLFGVGLFLLGLLLLSVAVVRHRARAH